VIVATPGRILDLASKKVANLEECGLLILDEVDKLLSMDFKVNIENLLSLMKPNRQICMYSATYPVQIKEFLDAHVPDPHFIRLSDEFTLKGVTQYYAYLEEREKLHCLNTLFSKLDISQAIIFCNTAKRVELLAKKID
jgi:ATP-dependent RNA helicase DDX6/DHH1